jgi:CheY-like chemotaxis protein
VLVADDSPDSAEAMGLVLKMSGHEVKIVFSGSQALAAASEFQPEVALLDIGMPGMSGYDLARELRATPWGRGLVLVAVTGWGRGEDKTQAVEAGFDHHLAKPVDPDALQALLRRLYPAN